VVPWLHLKEMIGIEVEFVAVDAEYDLDYADLEKKLTENVKVVSFTYASNVTGSVFKLERVGEILNRKYENCHPELVSGSPQNS